MRQRPFWRWWDERRRMRRTRQLRLAPILPRKPLHTRKLRDVRCHQREFTPQYLACNQQVVGPNRLAIRLQGRSHRTGNPSVFFFEGQHGDRTGEERLKPPPVGLLLSTLGDTVPEFKSNHRGHEDRSAAGNGFLKSSADPSRSSIDERDARVGIEEKSHLKISRRGATGCLRPFSMNGSGPKRSSSSNHFAVSATNGSNRTP